MSSSSVLMCLVLVVLGTLAVVVGRTLNTAEEDKWKEEHWFREVIYGPPGYYRAATILLGLLLIFLGIAAAFWELFIR